MVSLWASESPDTWWHKTYPTKWSAEVIYSGRWQLQCSSLEITLSRFRSRNPLYSPQSPFQPMRGHLVLHLPDSDLLVTKYIIKKHRANPPPRVGPISSWIDRKASTRLLAWHLCLLSQLGVWDRGRRLVLRPLHLPWCWVYPNSQRLDRSWKNSPSHEAGVLMSFCLQHPAPPLSWVQSWAGILFIIFCRASHAIFIKRRKSKAKGSVCKRRRRKEPGILVQPVAVLAKGWELGSRSIREPHPLGYSSSIALGAPEDGGACKHHGGIAER